MQDNQKTKAELLQEMETLRRRVVDLEEDKTEHRQVEVALRESEDRYKTLLDSSQDGVVIVALDGKILDANQAYQDMLGYTLEELKEITYQQFTPEKWHNMKVTAHELGLKKGHDISEKEYISKNGTIFPVFVSWWLIKDKQGNPEKLGAFVKDITEHKQAEETLAESEERYRSVKNDVLDSSKVGISILDKSFEIVWVNRALECYFGLRREEVIGKDKRRLIRRRIKNIFEDPEGFVEKVFATYDNNTYTENFECHVLADGRREDRWLEHWSQPISSGLFVRGRIEHYTDITERKRAQDVLRESEERYRALFQGAAEGIIVADSETKEFKYVNPAICKMLGYTEEELERLGVRDIHPKEDLQYIISEFEAQVRGEKTLASNIPCLRKDGTIMYADIKAALVSIDGKQCNVGFFTNVTDRKKAEEKLQESEIQFRRAQEVAHIGSWYLDLRTGQLIWSDETYRIFGVPIGKPLKEVDFLVIVHPDDKSYVEQSWAAALRGEQYDIEHRILMGGIVKWVREKAELEFDAEGKPVSGIGTVQDITKQKEREKELKDSEERYRMLSGNIPGMIYRAKADWSAEFFSHSETTCCGYFVEDLKSGKIKWLDIIHPDDKQRVFDEGSELAKEPGALIQEYRILANDGSVRWVEDHKTSTFTDEGKLVGVDGVVFDITERKLAEEALRESEERYKTMFQGAAEGIIVADAETKEFKYVNPVICNMLGYTQEELTRLSVHDIITKEELPHSISEFEATARGEKTFTSNISCLRKDGTIMYADINTALVLIDGRKCNVGFFTDITERKKTEDQQALRLKILKILHRYESLKVMCKETISLIKGYLDCEAVALRLRKDQDYPFFVNNGFPQAFLDSENHLCVHDKQGNVPKDSSGSPVLACVCGLVIKDKLNKGKSFFTKGGSFWTNSTTDLLSSTKIKTEMAATRNVCNKYGYESVALIPIKSSSENLGLLQVNDKRRDLFSSANIKLLEELGHLIGIAIEQKKAEQKVRESEEKYRGLTESLNELVYRADPETFVLTYVNSAIERFYGYSVEEWLRTPNLWEDLVHPDDKETVIREFEEAKRQLKNAVIEYRIIKKNKEVRWVEDHFSWEKDKEGRAISMNGIMYDITERKRAEQALREGEEKYRTLVESAGELICTIDENGVFLFINEIGAKRLGGKPEVCIGKTMWDLFPKKIADQQTASVRQVINTGEEINIITLTEMQGQSLWYNTTIEPLRDGSGEITAVMVIARDIHEHKQAEEELNKYRERMARTERLASVGTLSAIMAHTLNSPLTAIQLSIQNALAESKKKPRQSTIVEELKDGLRSVSEVSSTVRSLGKFASESSKEIIRKVNLKAVTERIVNLLNESAQRVRVSLHIEDMDKLPPIRSNEKDLEQLFFSMIENAIQAADGKKDRRVVISGAVKDKQIGLRFTDTCGGIASENLEKIFEPFFTTGPTGERTGLGLCIVERFVSEAGGKIRVESKAGKGSTFFVTLPINKK
ncbi:MAG: PAS domain S-box protein [Planctomycetes bacterium]|nr:PAS domain S-box protein [Planctomycetota bacterium]